MTIITNVGEKFQKLASVLSAYDKELDEVEERLSLKNKTIERSNMENPTWMSFYDQKKVELKVLSDFMDMKVDQTRGRLFMRYKENHMVTLNASEINQYINNEDAYIEMCNFRFEVQEVYEKYKQVIEAFRTRGYALNNITKMRVAAIEDASL